MAAEEFHSYDLKHEMTLVFCWPDFCSVVDLAQQLKCNIRLQFIKPGKPIVVNIETNASYSVALHEITLQSKVLNRKRKNTKVLTYKERMTEYMQKKGLDLSGQELESVLSPQIGAWDSEKHNQSQVAQPSTSKRVNQNLTDKDMDSMVAAAAAQYKPPKIISANETILHLSQQEQEEYNKIMQEMENFEDMDVDMPAAPPAAKSSTNDGLISVDGVRQDVRSLHEDLIQIEHFEVPADETEDPNKDGSLHLIPSEIMPEGAIAKEANYTVIDDSYRLSTQEKSGMRDIKRLLKPGSQGLKMKNSKVLCPGSDSEMEY